MNNIELKQELLEIREKEYKLEDSTKAYSIALSMLEHIGDLDPVLRDDLIYSTFATWAIEKKYFTKEQLKEFLAIALDESHLFYKVGIKNDDSIYTRTFSALLLPVFIYYHREVDAYLGEEEFERLKKTVVRYLKEEKDFSGYDKEKGWAHAVAHGADVLDQLAQCKELNKNDLLALLDIIKEKAVNREVTYVHEEDERLATAAADILKREVLTQEEFNSWIRTFEEIETPREDWLLYHHLVVNIKGFLRSLYFRIVDEKELSAVITQLKNTLDHHNSFKATE